MWVEADAKNIEGVISGRKFSISPVLVGSSTGYTKGARRWIKTVSTSSLMRTGTPL